MTMAGRGKRARVAGAIVLLVVLSGLGCGGSSEQGPTTEAGVSADAPSTANPDGEAGRDIDARAGYEEGLASSDDTNRLACFDGQDQDGDGDFDCADEGCQGSPVCCLGVTSEAACCGSPTATLLRMSSCARGPIGACEAIGARTRAGSPLVSTDGALVLASREGMDAIVDFPALELVPRAERITLTATIAAPPTTEQLDATAFGLWAATASGTSVMPLVAVVVSATRGDVSLLVGTRVVASAGLTAGTRPYELALSPDGKVSVTGASVPMSAVIDLPVGSVTPVLFGRVVNDAATPAPTRVIDLRVEHAPCDVPDALVRGGVQLLPDGETRFDEDLATDPSVLVDGTTVRVAFVTSGPANLPHAVFLGTRTASGLIEVSGPPITVAEVADALAPVRVLDVGGPDLHLEGTTVAMDLAFETEGGRWSLAHVEDVLGARRITAIPLGGGSYDDPERLPDGRLLARERLPGGGSRIVLLDTSRAGEPASLASGLCATESECPFSRDDDFVHRPSDDPLAFDHDEVRAPAAVEHDGVLRIYFAGRRGTRWSIGMLVAGSDPSYFRLGNDGRAVLAPGPGPFDTLGASGPAPFIDGTRLTLLYAGTDGARWRLLSASQPVRGL